MPNEIQRKHFQEREAVVEDALHMTLTHLARANNHFDAAIQDAGLQNEFTDGIDRARRVLVKLGLEF